MLILIVSALQYSRFNQWQASKRACKSDTNELFMEICKDTLSTGHNLTANHGYTSLDTAEQLRGCELHWWHHKQLNGTSQGIKKCEKEICVQPNFISFHLDKFKHSDWLKEIQQFPMFLF